MHVNFLSYRLPARRHRCVTTLATTHASSWTATATTAATPRSTLSAPWAQVRWLGLRLGLGLDLLVRLPPGHTGAQRVSALSQRRLPPQTLLLLPPHSTMQCHTTLPYHNAPIHRLLHTHPLRQIAPTADPVATPSPRHRRRRLRPSAHSSWTWCSHTLVGLA